ncbi:MAG: hypothetical protein R3E79_36610 [Caldilineaceae bacterium]
MHPSASLCYPSPATAQSPLDLFQVKGLSQYSGQGIVGDGEFVGGAVSDGRKHSDRHGGQRAGRGTSPEGRHAAAVPAGAALSFAS